MTVESPIPQKVIQVWPNCATADCENKACASLNSIYCGPCTKKLHADDSAPADHFAEFRRAQDAVAWIQTSEEIDIAEAKRRFPKREEE